MRCSLSLPARAAAAAALALALLAAAGPPARADVNVHGVRPGAQHSPSIAVTPRGTFVLSYDRPDTTSATPSLRLAVSKDGELTFQDLPLPVLPASWYWRPDAYIAYDHGPGQIWMVGQARTVGPDTTRWGVFVSSGFPLLDGTIQWYPNNITLWTQARTSGLLPKLALATQDGSGAAFVLFQNYETTPGKVTLFRIAEDLGSMTSQDLAAIDPGGTSYVIPVLAAGPGGDILAGWLESPSGPPQDLYPLVVRTSHDSGQTFGPKETVASIGIVPNGPGNALATIQQPTLLFAQYASDFADTRLAFWGSPYSPFPNVTDPSTVFLNSDCCSGAGWNEFGSTLPRGFGSYELNPAVAQAEDGYFYLGWHDFEPFDPDSISQFMVSKLWNMGFSASTPQPLASATFDWDNVVPALGSMGWKSGVSAFGDRVAFAWGDHRGADADVYAKGFRAGGFVQSQCAGDTVDVVAGQYAEFAWRIENHNELFADDYAIVASGTRPWANGFELDTVVVGPDGFADVTFGFVVPDTAAGGLMQVFAYTADRVRERSCPMFLRIQSLVAVDPGVGPAAGAGAVALSAPRPNPSAGATAFTFTLPATVEVDLAVYDLRGRRMATLTRGVLEGGVHTARWNGAGAAQGIYFARLTVRGGGEVATREQRLVVLR